MSTASIPWTAFDSDQFRTLLFDALNNYQNGPALLDGIHKFAEAGVWDVDAMKRLVADTGIPKPKAARNRQNFSEFHYRAASEADRQELERLLNAMPTIIE